MKKLILIPILIILFSINVFALDIQSKQIEINKNKIHYYQVDNSKSKPNLVMLTGIGTTANFWPKDFIERLSQKYNLYILDYRGINTDQDSSNLSYSINDLARDTNAFIKKLNLKETYLLGWSMGGAIALQTEFDNPKAFRQVFLISPAVPLDEKPKLPKKLAEKPILKTKTDVYNYVFSNNLYNYSSKDLAKNTARFINPDISKLFPTNKTYAKQKKYLTSWVSNKTNLKNFTNIKTPTTFFLAKNDKILNPNDTQKSLNLIKYKSVINVIHFSKSGHAIDWDKPVKLASIIDTLS
ncbi:alpha/beta hydrolase [Francisella sp. SYW-9]|uniref:alpha/beta hydrolase n=1 Tax=Francisella sp. SYW-9 TaxID=2610888 RepID=UPI00123D9E4B|nr:alpha/beta hydrolase [Francisella sp. SYW-9]